MVQTQPALGQDAQQRDFEADASTIAAAPTPSPQTDEDERGTPRTGSATENDAPVAPADGTVDDTLAAAVPKNEAPAGPPPSSEADKLSKPQIVLLMTALCVRVTTPSSILSGSFSSFPLYHN